MLGTVITLVGLSFSSLTTVGILDCFSGPYKLVEVYLGPEKRPPGLGTCSTQASGEKKTVSLT